MLENKIKTLYRGNEGKMEEVKAKFQYNEQRTSAVDKVLKEEAEGYKNKISDLVT